MKTEEEHLTNEIPDSKEIGDLSIADEDLLKKSIQINYVVNAKNRNNGDVQLPKAELDHVKQRMQGQVMQASQGASNSDK